MRKFLTIWTTIAFVTILLISMNTLVFASEPQSEIKKLANYYQRTQSIQVGLLELIDQSTELDGIISGVLDGEISKRYGLETGQNILLQFKLRLTRKGEELNRLFVPEFSSEKHSDSARKMRVYLFSLKAQIEGVLSDNAQTFHKLQTGQKIDKEEVTRREFARMKLLLGGENQMLAVRLIDADPNLPTYYNYKIYMLGNDFVMEVLGGLYELSLGEISDRRFTERMEANRVKLKGIHGWIQGGRKVVADFKAQMRVGKGIKEGTKRIFLSVADLYEASFKNEVLVAEALSNLASRVSGDENFQENSANLSKEMAKFAVLGSRRMSFLAERKELLSKLQ
jgi:hypothetical protein